MKQFLKTFLALLVVVIALLYICDFCYTQVYLNSNPRNKLQYILTTNNKKIDIAFLGSSRVANHINTNLFDSLSHKKTINLGVEGAGLNDNLLQLKLLIANNTVSNVYLQLDNNFEHEKPSNIGTAEAMPFISNPIVKDHVESYFSNYKKLAYIPFYRYALNDPKIGFREVFFSVVNKKPRIDPSNGFTPKFGTKLPLIGISLPEKIKNANSVLDKIIKLCEQHKIELTLYISPYCNKTKNIAYLERLALKIPNLIDLSKGYDDTLFYNCSHLNNEGANLFTSNLYNSTKDRIKN